MAELEGSIQNWYKLAADWTADNDILLAGQAGVELDTGQVKYGNGTDAWNDLPYVGTSGGVTWGSITGTLSDQTDLQNELDAKQDRVSALLTGGVITVETIDGTGTLNDIRVTSAGYYLPGTGDLSAPEKIFYNVAYSSTGLQRNIGIYGKSDGTIDKIEGAEGVLAPDVDFPANTVPFKQILVRDSSFTVGPDLSGYLLKADKASASDLATLTDDTLYATPFGLRKAITRKVILTTSFITTSATAVDITGLSISVTSGKTYLIEAFASFTTATSGSRVQLSLPAGTGRVILRGNLNDQIQRSVLELTATGESATMIPGAGAKGFQMMNGSFTPSADGVIKLQCRSISGGENTTALSHSTYLKITEL